MLLLWLQGAPSLEEVKQKLLKISNLPKKMEKFNNFVSHSFKVTDDSVSTT